MAHAYQAARSENNWRAAAPAETNLNYEQQRIVQAAMLKSWEGFPVALNRF
jgi:hypothetical protein